MYERYARRRGWAFTVLDRREDRAGGLRQATFEVGGDGVGALHREAGAHSIQHLTRSRNADRIHTSNASIVVFDQSELVARGDALVSRGDVRVDTFRGHGAGGQHRNVTDLAVRATYLPTGDTATVTSGRSQVINRAQALAVLASRIADREDADRRANLQRRRSTQARAGRAQTTRVYDLVRDMVRCERTGRKIRRVRKVLDGDLSELV
jgi:peptide chain release factor 1